VKRVKKRLSKRIEGRKSEHLKICLEKDIQARKVTTGFEDVCLVHRALPEVDRDKVDLSTVVFNHKFRAPLVVEAMTGGFKEATEINAAIAKAVEKLGLGMGVGSQRAAIENPVLEKTFTVVREEAPKAFIIANIGGPQIRQSQGLREAERAVEMIQADALAVHLNPLQEAVQPEGETNFTKVLSKITKIARKIDVPVIVKETGAGISAEEAKKLEAAKVAGIDVAGAGGTSWAAVEYHRAKRQRDEFRQRLGESFWDWGTPTAVSLVETVQSINIPVIASGGVHSGVDAAKALTLGASLVGMAHPVLSAATKGSKEVEKTLKIILEELKNAMFLVGAESIPALKKASAVITGKTADWLTMRGFQPELYARRGIAGR